MDLYKLGRKIIPSSIRSSAAFSKIKTVYFFKLFSRRINRQLKLTPSFHQSDKPYKGMRVLIPLLESSYFQTHHVLILAKILELRGAVVKVLLCSEYLSGCELKSIRNEDDHDPCWKCRFNIEHYLPLYGLNYIKINSFLSDKDISIIGDKVDKFIIQESHNDKTDKDLKTAIDESIIRYYYGLLPDESKEIESVRRKHTKTAITCDYIAKKIDSNWNPDIIFSNMFVYTTWAPFYNYFKNNGNRFRSITMTPFNYKAIVFNSMDLYPAIERYKSYFAGNDNKPLDENQNMVLDLFLNKRFTGKDDHFSNEGYFKKNNSIDFQEKSNLDLTKRNIFLFSNIYWDIGIGEMNYLYPDVITWVLRTVEILANQPDINLFVKTHPGEYYDPTKTKKGIAQIIRDKYKGNIPDNVELIEPKSQVKPYDLFPIIDLGVVFSGTLALEMMLNDVPVVSTGITPHHQLSLAFEPKNEQDYISCLLGDRPISKPSISEVRKFAYFYFIRSCMPWNLTDDVYASVFDGFNFSSLDDLAPKKNLLLDHLCECIMNLENTTVDSWPD